MPNRQFKSLVVMLASLLASPSSANDGWLELDLYECKDYPAALHCDKGCVKKEPVVRVRFRVDSNSNKVLVQTFTREGAQPHKRILSDCEVFDVENWDCSTKPPKDVVALATMKIETVVMTNGIYTAVADASLSKVIKPQCAK